MFLDEEEKVEKPAIDQMLVNYLFVD